jgi:hypothetical protein
MRRVIVKTAREAQDPVLAAELNKRKKLARKIARLRSGKSAKKSFPSTEEMLRADRER